jgi:hypothetical protein
MSYSTSHRNTYPKVRGDRDTPPHVRRDARKMPAIWGLGKAKCFFGQDWIAQISLTRLEEPLFS